MTAAICIECGNVSTLNKQGQAVIRHKKSCSESGLYEWHYLRTGKTSHARKRWGVGLDFSARCGTYPDYCAASEWRGTGSQKEYETAASLPKCKRCIKLIDGVS